MPDPNRPLSEGQIAALKRLKRAYDDAVRAGEEPPQFAAKKDELMAEGTTARDLASLVKKRYVGHLREVTRDGEPRRQFQAANASAVGPDSCFFLTYAGNVYIERSRLYRRANSESASRRRERSRTDGAEKSNHRRKPSKARAKHRAAAMRPSPPRAKRGERDVPIWVRDEGNLYFRSRRIIERLAPQASAERAILDRFQKKRWKPCVPNPIPRETAGDPTHSRRSAVYNLNKHLRKHASIIFFSTRDGYIGWRARAT